MTGSPTQGNVPMIAITAATGNVGRQLAGMLAAAGTPARLFVRDLGTVDTYGGKHEPVMVDLDHGETLDPALTGVGHLFLLSPGPDTPAQDATAIAAAARAGVQHVVLLSSLGIEAGGIGGGRPHAPGEDVLKKSGLDWTILRPSEYMTNTLAWLPEITARGTISVPSGHGKVALIAPADIAAVAFTTLTQPGHTGHTYRLTGPESLTTADLAERLSAVLGKPVRHIDNTVQQFRQAGQQMGIPTPVLNTLAEYYPALAEGRMDILAPDVEDVTGRPATPYLDWARTAFPDPT